MSVESGRFGTSASIRTGRGREKENGHILSDMLRGALRMAGKEERMREQARDDRNMFLDTYKV